MNASNKNYVNQHTGWGCNMNGRNTTPLSPSQPPCKVNYFWRRVFEQKRMQTCTNAGLVHQWWLREMIPCVQAAIDARESRVANATRGVTCRFLERNGWSWRHLPSRRGSSGKGPCCSMELMPVCCKGNSAKGGEVGGAGQPPQRRIPSAPEGS